MAVRVFHAASGQWRVGFAGPYALDYAVLPIVAPEEYRSPEWPEIFESIQIMEEAALKMIHAKRDKR